MKALIDRIQKDGKCYPGGIPFHHVAAIHHHDSHQPLSDNP